MRKYNRRLKYNKTYRGEKTKHIRQIEKSFGKFLVIGTIAMYAVCGIYQISAPETITIQGSTENPFEEAPPVEKLDFESLSVKIEPPEIKEKADIQSTYTVPNGIKKELNHNVNVTTDKDLISDYIRSKDWNDEHALLIFTCESKLNPYAFNPETGAKAKGLTKYSSCGIAQINSPLCDKSGCILFDYKYNIDRAYELWKSRFWQPWINCSNKHGIPLYR